MSVDILPDSRCHVMRGSTRSPHGNMIPIYCANCGAPQGMAPEKLCTFAFALCQPCADVYGDSAHFHKEPDAVFWDRVAEAQKNEGVNSPAELESALSDTTNPLSKLAAEWQALVRRTM